MQKKFVKIALIIFAAGIVGGVGYVVGWHSPNHITTGYGYGSEDGYSIGYRDGQIGANINPDRRMTEDDYAFRISMGGRAIGDP